MVGGGLLGQNSPEFYDETEYRVDFVVTIEWNFSVAVLMPASVSWGQRSDIGQMCFNP